jgi:hypothetical protein
MLWPASRIRLRAVLDLGEDTPIRDICALLEDDGFDGARTSGVGRRRTAGHPH